MLMDLRYIFATRSDTPVMQIQLSVCIIEKTGLIMQEKADCIKPFFFWFDKDILSVCL